MPDEEIPTDNPPTLDPSEWPTGMPQPAVPGLKIGHYKLMRELGAGGCGVVFLAEQSEPLRRRVALKIIRLGMDTAEVIARFQVERQALALMDHPNIARVLDAGATPTGRPFFVMELVNGPKITDYCDEHKFTLEERLRLFLSVCQALQHAHQKGIIHRDIKPSNILVATQDNHAVPKVIDFGIAKATGGRLTDQTLYTAYEQFFGTPAYMSPEQAGLGGLDIDTRSDIYSLGVLLYEMLAGETPLDAHSLAESEMDEVRRQIRDVEPPRPSARLSALDRSELATIAQKRHTEPARLVAGLRGDLDWIIMKCLEKDRQRRYDNVGALAADIQRHLQHEPVNAGPPSTFYLLSKFARRHRPALATAATFALLLVGATVVSLWLAHRAQLAAVEATRQSQAAEQQKEAADQERHEVQLAYNQMDVTAAVNQLGLDNPNEAVAYLCRALRTVPDNRNAASLLFSVLNEQNWLLPTAFFQSANATLDLNAATGHIAAAAGNNSVRVTDLATGQLLATILTPAPVGKIGFNPDGKFLLTIEATAGRGGFAGRGAGGPPDSSTARDGPPPSGLDRNGNNGPGGPPPRENRGPRGRGNGPGGPGRGPARGAVGPVRVWDIATGRQVSPAGAFPTDVSHAQLSADGSKLLTVAGTNVTIWDITTGQAIGPAITAPGRISSIQWSGDGRKIVLAARENTPNDPGNPRDYVGVWDAASGQPVFPPLRTEVPVNAVALNPDASCFITALNDGTAHLWNAATGESIGETMHHQAPVRTVAFSANGQMVITGDADNTARIWNAGFGPNAGQPLSAPLRGDSALSQVAFNPDGRSVLTATATGEIQQWAFSARGNDAPPAGSENVIIPGSFSEHGRRMAILLRDGSMQVWDTVTLQPVSPLLHREGSSLFTPGTLARLSPDGRLLALEMDNRTVRVWDVATGQPVSAPMAHASRIRALAFSDNGKRLVTVADDNTARVWDAATGQPITAPLAHSSRILAVTFSTDGQSVLTAAADRTVRSWDVATGESTLLSLRLETPLSAAAFSPDGQWIVVAGANSARVWKLDGQPVSAPMDAAAPISAVYFSPDGQSVLTTSNADNTSRLWDATTGEPISVPLHQPRPGAGGPFGPGSPGGAPTSPAAWNDTLRFWAAPTQPVPRWIIELAETLAQCRIDTTGAPASDHGQPLANLRSDATAAPDPANPFVQWARRTLGVNATSASSNGH
jgi:WD40 repeat protein/serine/threonine protein kinase